MRPDLSALDQLYITVFQCGLRMCPRKATRAPLLGDTSGLVLPGRGAPNCPQLKGRARCMGLKDFSRHGVSGGRTAQKTETHGGDLNRVLLRQCDQSRRFGRILEAHWRIWERGFVCIMGYILGCLSRWGFLSGSRFPGEPPRRQRTLALHGSDYRQGPFPLPLPLEG